MPAGELALDATYYDGRTTTPHDVVVRVSRDGVLHVAGDGISLDVRPEDVRIAPRLGDAPRSLTFVGGDKCETRDNDAVDAIARLHRTRKGAALVHRLESSWRFAALSVVVLLVAGVAAVVWGIPLAAAHVARGVPDALAYRVGESTLAVLDESLFDPSALDEDTQARVRAAFDSLAGRAPDLPLALTFRAMGAANAFALPDGTVVVTDELVALADGDDELKAVLAHEIGHVHHRHGLRMALESSSMALLLGLYLGDAAQVSTTLTALPTLYAQAGYSRSHEEEADGYALALLEEAGIDPGSFATIMEKLDGTAGAELPEAMQYLASHPPTEERIERFRARASAAHSSSLP